MSIPGSTAALTSDSFGPDDLDESIRGALSIAIVDSSEDAIICESLDGRIRLWNRGATRLFGYQANEVIGKHITLLISPELQAEEDRILNRLRRGERVEHFETTRTTKDGRRIEVSLTISPVCDKEGTIIATSKIVREIGERKRAERATARLAAIVDSSDDAIVSKTLDGIVQSWNDGATRIFGYTEDEAIGKSIMMLIPPELREEERLILSHIRKGKRINHFDTIRVAKDGRRIPISLTVSPVRDTGGAVIGASKVARDISERRHFEHALRENERLLIAEAGALAKLNELSAKLWRCRRLHDGLNEMLSAIVDLFGADAASVGLIAKGTDRIEVAAHRGVQPLIIQDDVSAPPDKASLGHAALRSGQAIMIDDLDVGSSFAPFRAVTRAAGYGALVCVPLLGGDSEQLGVVSVFFRDPHRPAAQQLRRLDLYVRQACDFIQRCRIEDQLREQEEALLAADRRKDEFLAILAHELRNPLAPIRYALAATKKGTLTQEQRQRTEEVIDRQVAHMSTLLDDLLDVSRITRGTLDLKKSLVDLASIIGEAIEAVRPILDAKNHTLSVELPNSAIHIEADPVRLTQVFSNLLINAAKYTDRGGRIEVRAESNNRDIVVSVRDNGIGIAPEMMPKLFAMFTRSRDAIGRSEGGLGVGLALVEGLVQLHGGRIEAHSEGTGRGSDFIVRLPISKNKAALAAMADRGPTTLADGQRILVVDDNRDAAETCRMLLELSGHQVEVGYTGSQALELVESFRPQICLLDIALPDQSGYEIARTIRSRPSTRDMALVAVTGFGQEDDRRRAFDAGFDQHITKPIASDLLEAIVKSLANATQRNP